LIKRRTDTPKIKAKQRLNDLGKATKLTTTIRQRHTETNNYANTLTTTIRQRKQQLKADTLTTTVRQTKFNNILEDYLRVNHHAGSKMDRSTHA
jgi:hypothetical protein